VNGINDRIFATYTIGESIFQGPIKLIFVPAGCLQYIIDIRTSDPILLGPGMHYYDDVNISIPNNSLISLNSGGKSMTIKFGASDNYLFIFVRTGERAVICTRTGDIAVMQPGLHFLEAPDSFRTFVSVQQEHLRFGSCDSNAPTFLTADNVGLHVEATMFYSIVDVHTAFSASISTLSDLNETLRSQAMSSLMALIRSETFSNIGSNKRDRDDYETKENSPSVNATAPSAPPASSQPMPIAQAVATGFQNIIHEADHTFKGSMSLFAERFGFEIQSLRIEKIEFADKHLQSQISDFAVGFTKLAAQQATIAAERKVELAMAEREAAKMLISANAENERSLKNAQMKADTARLTAENEAQIVKVKAEAEGEALRMKGKAEADVITMKADADAAAIRAVGEAEALVLQQKGAHPNSALSLLVEGQVKAFQGVEKIVYCNSDTQPLLQQISTVLAAQGSKRG
jgi:regulator of protease activity HflC (stomatin/prohibitin superfamily)